MENKFKILIFVLSSVVVLSVAIISGHYNNKSLKLLLGLHQGNVSSIEIKEITSYKTVPLNIDDKEVIQLFLDTVSARISNTGKSKGFYDYSYQIDINRIEGLPLTLSLYKNIEDNRVFVYIHRKNGAFYYMVEDLSNIMEIINKRYEELNNDSE